MKLISALNLVHVRFVFGLAGLLILGLSSASYAVVFTDPTQIAFQIALPKSLGGASTQIGSWVNAATTDILVDPSGNTIISSNDALIVEESATSTVTQTLDFGSGLGSSAFSGSVTNSSGADSASSTLTVTAINVVEAGLPQGIVGSGITAGSFELQTLRFDYPGDIQISVSVASILGNTITGDPLPGNASAIAVSAFGVFDLSTFSQTSEDDLFVFGIAESLVFRLSLDTGVGSSSLVVEPIVFSAMTNTTYAVWLGASASVNANGLDGPLNSPLDLTVRGFADPVFSVDDPEVQVVRSITRAEVPIPVPEPPTLMLLGLGLLGIGFLRHRRAA